MEGLQQGSARLMRSGTICALCFEPSSKLLHSSSLASLIASLLQFLVDNPDVHSFSFKGKPFSRRPAAHTSNMRCQGITCLAVLNKWHQILVFTCLATVRRPACQLRPWHGHPREPELAVGAHGGAVTPFSKYLLPLLKESFPKEVCWVSAYHQ